MTNPLLQIRYRDEVLVVVDKPSGLPTQATRDRNAKHLYQQVLSKFPNASLHHRLDTPSSGLVLFTVSPTINRHIGDAFKHHTIDRRYLAVVVGDPGSQGTWDNPIEGKMATTHFERIGMADGMSLIEARLETGRTHQIRIHAAQSGHPIVGDRRHGGAARRLWPRLALHAVSLSLVHPQTGQPLKVCAPIPQDLSSLLEPMHSDLGRRYSPTIEAD